MPDKPTSAQDTFFPSQLTYAQISTKHDDWDGRYLRRLRAFYKGGKELLGNRELMEDVFPRAGDESGKIYDLRCKLAFYVNYAGEIINFITSSLSAEHLAMKLKKPAGAEQDREIDEWYSDFFEDVSPKGGKTVSLHEFARQAVLEALITRVAWARVDLPQPGQYQSQSDQESAGGLDAFAIAIPAECVIDWEEDESGELLFAVLHSCEQKRTSLRDARGMVTETFRVYTAQGWAKYQLVREKNKAPNDQDLVTLEASGPHTFGRVPICRLDVGDGLWAMDNIEGACREHLNKRSGLAWAERQSLFSELYEFLGPEEGGRNTEISGAQADANRAVTQHRGQGFVQVRGAGDRAEYVGPPAEAFNEARVSCAEIRDEIHRVTHQMALAADNTAAALKRSAESKGADKASAVVVFEALGQLARKFAEDITNMVSRGRQDVELVDEWQATGMAKFDAISVDAAIQQAGELELVKIPSPTFQKLFKLSLAKSVLGDDASPDDLEAIEDELEENIKAEEMGGGDKPEKVRIAPKGETPTNEPSEGEPAETGSEA